MRFGLAAWHDGKYSRFPWPRRPEFTGVGIVAVTPTGRFANVGLRVSELDKIANADLIVSVFEE